MKERKGWSITIHDLSGSPVAAASTVTPFVPSLGTDRVSRSNPGAWLILRHSHSTWKPWGRLEAWRDGNGGDLLGYHFELISEDGIDTTPLANSTISAKNGGKFSIDITTETLLCQLQSRAMVNAANQRWNLGILGCSKLRDGGCSSFCGIGFEVTPPSPPDPPYPTTYISHGVELKSVSNATYTTTLSSNVQPPPPFRCTDRHCSASWHRSPLQRLRFAIEDRRCRSPDIRCSASWHRFAVVDRRVACLAGPNGEER
ncbi:unnamed protein product [Fraxinus pennsylvanica]|uniref:Uncharacterized protein n=1 Tax=Fraxinus pennsylvanica TaxID=56036 RepID=A0AAD2DQC8_9LAMI|nr:unnamed protein product [Fraxinus pennsylvanica]